MLVYGFLDYKLSFHRSDVVSDFFLFVFHLQEWAFGWKSHVSRTGQLPLVEPLIVMECDVANML